jgi:hypothetical protein
MLSRNMSAGSSTCTELNPNSFTVLFQHVVSRKLVQTCPNLLCAPRPPFLMCAGQPAGGVGHRQPDLSLRVAPGGSGLPHAQQQLRQRRDRLPSAHLHHGAVMPAPGLVDCTVHCRRDHPADIDLLGLVAMRGWQVCRRAAETVGRRTKCVVSSVSDEALGVIVTQFAVSSVLAGWARHASRGCLGSSRPELAQRHSPTRLVS